MTHYTQLSACVPVLKNLRVNVARNHKRSPFYIMTVYTSAQMLEGDEDEFRGAVKGRVYPEDQDK
jgi:hypothetical protein